MRKLVVLVVVALLGLTLALAGDAETSEPVKTTTVSENPPFLVCPPECYGNDLLGP